MSPPSTTLRPLTRSEVIAQLHADVTFPVPGITGFYRKPAESATDNEDDGRPTSSIFKQLLLGPPRLEFLSGEEQLKLIRHCYGPHIHPVTNDMVPQLLDKPFLGLSTFAPKDALKRNRGAQFAQMFGSSQHQTMTVDDLQGQVQALYLRQPSGDVGQFNILDDLGLTNSDNHRYDTSEYEQHMVGTATRYEMWKQDGGMGYFPDELPVFDEDETREGLCWEDYIASVDEDGFVFDTFRLPMEPKLTLRYYVFAEKLD